MSLGKNIPEIIIYEDAIESFESDAKELNRRSELLIEEGQELLNEAKEFRNQYAHAPSLHRPSDAEIDEVIKRIHIFGSEINRLESDYRSLMKYRKEAVEIVGDYPEFFDYPQDVRRIDKHKSEIEQRIDELEVISERFREFTDLVAQSKAQSDFEIEEINKEKAKLTSIRERSDSLIDDLREYEEKIDSKLEVVEEQEEDLAENQEELDRLLETASDLVKGQAGAYIGRQFEERKEELEKGLFWWKIASVLSIASLVIFSIYIYRDLASGSIEGITSLSTVSLVLPISVAVWFSVSQFNQQKRLMQEYEFKSNMALSLMGFREVLKEDIPEDEQVEVGKFIISTMDKIYSNPQENTRDMTDNSQDDPLTAGQKPLVEFIKRMNQ